jgi:hypothetical protein
MSPRCAAVAFATAGVGAMTAGQSLAARWPSFARLGPLGIESTGAQTASRFRELFMGEAGVLVPAAAAVLAGLGLWASAHPFGR